MNQSDVLTVNALLTQFVTEPNFLKDVNLSATLTLSDVAELRHSERFGFPVGRLNRRFDVR